MLTLTRTIGEVIRIGDDIEVHVVEVRGNTVRLGFNAPREIPIHRQEVYQQIAAARDLAARVTADAVGALSAALGRSKRPAAATSATAEDGARASDSERVTGDAQAGGSPVTDGPQPADDPPMTDHAQATDRDPASDGAQAAV